MLVYGAFDRDAPVYYTNVTPTVWGIFALGSLSLILGMLIAGGSQKSDPTFERISFAGSDLFFWAGAGAVVLSLINYATGDIPLLADDINGARLGGNYGILGRAWPLIHPVLQVSVTTFLLRLQQRRINTRWLILGILSAISLILAAGRSFSAIVVIAFGLLFLEIKRPKIQIVLSAMVAGLLLFGIIGQLRAMSSSDVNIAQSYMSKRGLDTWFGSTDLALQTGPRVLTLAIDHQHGKSLEGQLLVGDLGNFINSSITRSDQLVTEILGRDPGVIGGSPPTIFGGLFLDFGWTGVFIGALIVGLILTISRRVMYRKPSLPTLIWFSYFGSYVAISGYSYVGFRPSWLVVLAMCIAAEVLQKETNGANTTSLEVQGISGRGRTSRI